jgi:hypothetical protein
VEAEIWDVRAENLGQGCHMTETDSGFFAIEEAWWRWVDEHCPSKSPRARGKWMRANEFSYDGAIWQRNATPYKSNSGKTIVDRMTVFNSNDGRALTSRAGSLNRRNDADRNWGLGRE